MEAMNVFVSTDVQKCGMHFGTSSLAGNHSWTSYFWPSGEQGRATFVAPMPAARSAESSAESILSTSQQFSLTLAGLRSVFTPVLFKGVLSFMTWWLCAVSFATSVVGLVYHSYALKA